MMAEVSDVSMATGSGSSASNRQVREAAGYRPVWFFLYKHDVKLYANMHNLIMENIAKMLRISSPD